jgi:hypothetical protein
MLRQSSFQVLAFLVLGLFGQQLAAQGAAVNDRIGIRAQPLKPLSGSRRHCRPSALNVAFLPAMFSDDLPLASISLD